MSTWLRTCSMPLATYQRSTSSARSTTSSRVSIGLRSLQQAMPSQSVPLSFHRGSPAVSVESRCTCGSTNGALISAPCASMTWRASGCSC